MKVQFIKPFYMDEGKNIEYSFWVLYCDEGETLNDYEWQINEDYREIYIPRTTLLSYLIDEGEKHAYNELVLLAKMSAVQYGIHITIEEEIFKEICDELKRKTYKGICFSVLRKTEKTSEEKYVFGCSFLGIMGENNETRRNKEISEEKKYKEFLNRMKEANIDILDMNDQDLLAEWTVLVDSIEWHLRGFRSPKEKENYYRLSCVEEEMKKRDINFKPKILD